MAPGRSQLPSVQTAPVLAAIRKSGRQKSSYRRPSPISRSSSGVKTSRLVCRSAGRMTFRHGSAIRPASSSRRVNTQWQARAISPTVVGESRYSLRYETIFGRFLRPFGGAAKVNYHFGVAYFNSLKIAFINLTGAVLTSTLAGYAFARLNFYGKNVTFAGITRPVDFKDDDWISMRAVVRETVLSQHVVEDLP